MEMQIHNKSYIIIITKLNYNKLYLLRSYTMVDDNELFAVNGWLCCINASTTYHQVATQNSMLMQSRITRSGKNHTA